VIEMNEATREWLKRQPIWHTSELLRAAAIGVMIGFLVGFFVGFDLGVPNVTPSMVNLGTIG